MMSLRVFANGSSGRCQSVNVIGAGDPEGSGWSKNLTMHISESENGTWNAFSLMALFKR